MSECDFDTASTKLTQSKWIRKPRKLKTFGEARDFKCGCGKTYLSYMALYLHIAQKHNKVTPMGTTTKTGNVPKVGRGPGRPKGKEEQISGEISVEELASVYIEPFCRPKKV